MREEDENADYGDKRGAKKSQGAAYRHRPTDKIDEEAAQVMGLYAPPSGGHGVRHHRQTNRIGEKYGEEALWNDGDNAGEKIMIL